MDCCCCCCSTIQFPEPEGPYPVSALAHRFPNAPACQIFYPSSPGAPSTAQRSYWRAEAVDSIKYDMNCCTGAVVHCCLGWRLAGTPHPCATAPAVSGGKFPLVIFSHGLYGSMSMYTSLCSLVASFGFVVVAIEHEDGSAIFARPAGSDSPIKYKQLPPEPTPASPLEHGSAEHYAWAEKMQLFNQEQRRPFLDKRISEIGLLLAGIKAVAAATDSADLLAGVIGAMDASRINLMGHSFGSTTAIRASVEMQIPVQSRVILDLWPTPLPSEAYVVTDIPSLFIGSESFRDFPMTTILTKELAAKSTCGLNRSAATSVLLRHEVEYPNLASYRNVEAQEGVPKCELLYMKGSAHQQCSDTPQFCPGWLGRRFGLSGDCDWEIQHHELSRTIAAFLLEHNGRTASEDLGEPGQPVTGANEVSVMLS